MATETTLRSNYSRLERDLIDEVKRRGMVAIRRAQEDMIPYLNTEVRKIFREVIDEFYDDYTPLLYNRDYSMYTILETRVTKDTDINFELWFEPTNMTTFRSGYDGWDGLYDLTFRKGWHGGADLGPGHPDILTPYWRTPSPGYSHWGREAKRMNPSPLELFRQRLEEAFKGRFTAHYQELIDKRTAEMYD